MKFVWLCRWRSDSEGANVFSELSVAGYSRSACPTDTVLPPPNFPSSSLVTRRVVNDATSVASASVMPRIHHVIGRYHNVISIVTASAITRPALK